MSFIDEEEGDDSANSHYYRHVVNDTASKGRAYDKILWGMRQRSSSIDLVLKGEGGDQPSPIQTILTHERSASDPADVDEVDSIEASESGSPMHGSGSKLDIREILFEAIPEPYYVPTQYQRINIEELETVDDDSSDACRKLKRCLDLRKKWIEHHPSPPQDLVREFDGVVAIEPGTPLRIRKRQTSNGDKEIHPHEFRRREQPAYNVFIRPLPNKIDFPVEFVMVDGVFRVYRRGPSEVISALEGNDTSPDDSVGSEAGADSGPAPPPPTPVRGVDAVALAATSFTAEALEVAEANSAKGRDAQQTGIKSPPKSATVDKFSDDVNDNLCPVLSFQEFLDDFTFVRETIFSGVVASYAFKRLELLAARYNIHLLLNGGRELEAVKSVPHRDFYNVRKVDTHVHHSACMNQKHLLRFIKHKLRYNPNEIVSRGKDGQLQSLSQVFQRLGLTAYDLSIDTLDMHANDTFQRFDRFNLKYNPAGQSELREIFLKTDNYLEGKYLAELTKEVMDDLTSSKYQLAEWRVSIYGKRYNEWFKLAKWFYDNKLAHSNVRWLIQVPRLFQIYRNNKELTSFAEMLKNIFGPLFEASANPAAHPEIHYFLETVVAFDSVDDESRPEHGRLASGAPIGPPEQWTMNENPPYGYWMYYMYANILALNSFRAKRRLCTFQFRPHCGEAGDIDHLVSTFLVAHQINHGILLRKNTGLHYLYYLAQIGIAISPLSNNKLFLDYHKNPFIKYFKQGMNVSLSTDDPLMLHYTKDALLEEYSVATQVWKLSSTDQCEIARNSVLQSGWESRYKRHYLGEDLKDVRETNVCAIRLSFRQETFDSEMRSLELYANQVASSTANIRPRFMDSPAKAFQLPPPAPQAQTVDDIAGIQSMGNGTSLLGGEPGIGSNGFGVSAPSFAVGRFETQTGNNVGLSDINLRLQVPSSS